MAADPGRTLTNTLPFAEALLIAAVIGLAVLAASRLTERAHVPLPAMVLIVTAVAATLIPGVHRPTQRTVEQVVTVALVMVLFDGGMHIGRRRLRSATVPVLVVGVVGTFGTAALAAALGHLAFGLALYPAVLVATAVAPTDPTVVFSVLGRRQISGRSGTILEGESGANDPVGIALMAGLLGAGSLSGSGLAHVAGTFALQMAVGLAVGVAGGRVLLIVMRRVPLPGPGLYPLRTLAGAFLLYGVATVGRGSGFLAVFSAGILIGDERAPFKREIERFHGALASLGEIVAFVALGLTVDLAVLGRLDVWLPGLVLSLALAVAIRPLVVGACLAGTGLATNERRFVQFAGLKGAVPILLGGYILGTRLPDPARLYGIVVVVVVFSVVVQGGLVGPVTRYLRLPVEILEPEPWAIGVRLRDEPQGVHEFTVGAGSPADGTAVADLPGLPEDSWITLLVRDGQLMAVRGDTVLRAGDRLTVLADAEADPGLGQTFKGG